MAIEDILKKIGQKNQKDIEHIKKEAFEKCKQIKKETEGEIKELKEKSKNEAKTSVASLKEHMLQEARLKIAKGILETKSDILDEIFEEALQKLGNLSTQEYLTWMEEMLLKVVEPGENEIILPKEVMKKQDIEKFLKRVNERLKSRSCIKLSKETREIGGGFILKRQRKEINSSFKSLLEEKLNSLRIKISQLLFENEGTRRER
jgi:V/A-type H+-transporting ATPase subunit E